MTLPEPPGYPGRVVSSDGDGVGTCAMTTIDPLAGGAARPALVCAVDQMHNLAVLVCQEPLPGSVVGLVPTELVTPRAAVAVSGVAKFRDGPSCCQAVADLPLA